ncbi:MAG: hypothetical protein R3335_12215, partial [Anaerolineales bacterium]|nr:hypothetical protein [Anaerolineales bacterium]
MPLLYLSLAFLAGIQSAAISGLPVLFWVASALAAGLLLLPRARARLLPARSRLSLPPLAALLLFVCLGGLRFQLS